MAHTLTFTIHENGTPRQEAIAIEHAVIAGWTGRDQEALEKHIVELEEMGIARPASTPIFYRVAASRLTSAPEIEVSGGDSSGEVEFVLVQHAGKLYVGVASDHTDRKVEAYNVTVSKQMCDKPVAAELWAYDEVRPHWDSLELRSWIAGDTLYQEGPVTKMRDPQDLLPRYAPDGLADGTLMFGGTLAAIGGIRPSERLTIELADPVLGRTIRHSYAMRELPVMG
jgi:hypothetical protein